MQAAPRVITWGVLLGGALSPACGPEPASDVTFARDVAPLFESNCVEGCHLTTETNAGEPDLSADVAYAEVVNRASVQAPALVRVAPGDLEGSYLWHKVLGTHEAVGGEGEQMPYGGTPLPQRDLDVIRRWIEQGALE